ncbi:PhoX family phosphatase [Arenicella sp. 4NH20-0111]|uniref:PhoX family protein n=1 Tax=Arenicella sp. 4NH20-0111 TaxID=3127648 RepID=UPI00310794A8
MNDQGDNRITNRTAVASFFDVCERRFSRRGFVKASLAVGGSAAALTQLSGCGSDETEIIAERDNQWRENNPYKSRYDFKEIEHGADQHHHVAPDHDAQILIRWGDPLFKDSPEFDPLNQTAESQSKQFGYNNDYVGYLSLEPLSGQQARALLCVNHEYPIAGLMFPDFPADGYENITEEQVKVTQAAVGNSIVEVGLKDGSWTVNTKSKYNRRISALDTEIAISGPAAGHHRMKTSVDKRGKTVIGTMNNCAGGMTPWGTYLTCEENFNGHFSGEIPGNHPEAENHKRYNVPTDYTHWGGHDRRFDIGIEPNEPNRFGWVVEIDPLDPNSKPKKRTALGRFKHEGGECIVAPSGQLVVYMGDDQQFEYVYKFVSRDAVDMESPRANRDLLDEGTLYVAKFYSEGYLEWMPLTHDNGPLQAAFESQADVLIDARKAADLLGATPMDRPEDVVPNKETGKVYVMLTNNSKRSEGNHANPRAENYFGHIIEITELDNDYANERGYWDIVVKCGNPDIPSHQSDWSPETTKNGWFASPDNGVVDPQGRLWVSSDQGSKTFMTGTNDGLWALETEGALRGTGKMFFRVPDGAEMCGPAFSDDGESLFVAVQHPGDKGRAGEVRVETAATRWPDFNEKMPPRPSIVAIRKKTGGKIA